MPSSAILSFTDPYPYQVAFRAAQLEFLPTERGDFRAELTKVDFHRLWIQRGEESLPRIFHGAVSPQRAAIGFLSDWNQPEYRHCGRDVSPGAIIINDQNEMHRQTRASCRWGAMSLTLEDLGNAGIAIAGRPVARPPVSLVVRPAPVLMSQLLTLHETAGRLAKTAPDVLANPEVARALENALIHTMIMSLTENGQIASRAGTQRHSLIMARFEEFQAAHASTPLYLAEICAAIGVSERTLRASCQEQLGMGPIHYLWLRRMHLVRRTLASAGSSGSTVTRIAADFGFWEFGRFSGQYRRLFGELPSETLRRSRMN